MYKFNNMSLLNKTKSNTLYFKKKKLSIDGHFIKVKKKKQHKKLTQNYFLLKKKKKRSQHFQKKKKKTNTFETQR